MARTHIKYMLYGLTLKEITFEVGISLTTAFDLRHKILEAMKDYQDDNMLNGEVQVDETYIFLNMEGPWKNKDMPRKAKKRGTPSKYRGTSSGQENRQHETFNDTIANQVTMTYASIPEKPWPIDIYKPYQHLS